MPAPTAFKLLKCFQEEFYKVLVRNDLFFTGLAMTHKDGQVENIEFPCGPNQFCVFQDGPRRSVPSTQSKTISEFCESSDATER